MEKKKLTVKELIELLEKVKDKNKPIAYFEDSGKTHIAKDIIEFGNVIGIL